MHNLARFCAILGVRWSEGVNLSVFSGFQSVITIFTIFEYVVDMYVCK